MSEDLFEAVKDALINGSNDRDLWWFENRHFAWLYGVIWGFNPGNAEYLVNKFRWSDEVIEQMQLFHQQWQILESVFKGRVGKLLKKGKFFIVIAQDEPYFTAAYDMIRKREIEIGRWSEEDEAVYREKTSAIEGNWSKFKSKTLDE